MQLIQTSNELQQTIEEIRRAGQTIGLVPTMGALHTGHLELVKRSIRENDCTIVSIFVNPTQFNDPKDLERYPRTLEADCALLESVQCNFVFAPSVEEVYPTPVKETFDFGALAQVMEGVFRPGHFDGVAQIVGRLFEMVTPDRAYFGEKDFQQLAIVQELVKLRSYPLTVVPCPIVRQSDGLAMSSRNRLLTPEQRLIAPSIYAILSQSTALRSTLTVDQLKQWMVDRIDQCGAFRLEYFDIVDPLTLQPLTDWSQHPSPVGCIALYCGEIRLIDNIRYVDRNPEPHPVNPA